MPDTDCPRCERPVPEGSRFCPQCGLALDEAGDTVVDQLPLDETGPVPVHHVTARPRLVGLGERLLEELRRRAEAAMEPVRSGTTLALEALKTRSGAEKELLVLRHRLKGHAGERERLFRDLGEVVYRGDGEGKKSLEAKIAAVEDKISGLEDEMKSVVASAGERMQQVQLEVQPTQIETPQQPEVPEPYPPPGEADPPSQPEIPEPYPPPGELDPPAQPDIPEPFPPGEPE